VEEAVAEPLGLGDGQLAGQAQRLGECQQVIWPPSQAAY